MAAQHNYLYLLKDLTYITANLVKVQEIMNLVHRPALG